jgi:hypothetical protein
VLKGGNYTWFDRFQYPEGEEPTYLEDAYGIEVPDDGERKLNVGRIVGENVEFVDSRANQGVQVADLLASGIRRCLRGEFADNTAVAKELGCLMVQQEKPNVPVDLIALGNSGAVAHDTATSLRAMKAAARGMLC